MATVKSFTAIALFAILFGFNPLVSAGDHWSDDWKIKVDDDATSAGTIRFTISLEPGAGAPGVPWVVNVLVPDGTKENDIAELISVAFRTVLNELNFTIKHKNGEELTIKTRGETPDIALELTGNTVQGIKLEIDN
ncbi:MAG: hypothetical protein DRQ97_08250 [Gammaproteobacteria bacterium]|nr:MAG: hypothetical protein DRQ97_08250 [Gammaproteobacteria bacterium]